MTHPRSNPKSRPSPQVNYDRWLHLPVLIIGGVVILAAYVLPLLPMVTLVAGEPQSPIALSSVSSGLLMRSVALALAGAGGAVLLGSMLAVVAGRAVFGGRHPVLMAMLLAPMLCPPMVYAFGWARVLRIPAELLCICVWVSWTWPVAALMVSAAWARRGHAVWEALLLDTGRIRAAVSVIGRLFGRDLGLAFLIVFVLLLGDYAVPHACGLMVYSTELLVLAQEAVSLRAILRAAAPGVAILGCVLIGARLLWRNVGEDDEAPPDRRATWRSGVVAWIGAGMILPPLVILMGQVAIVPSMTDAVRTYGGEMVKSLMAAGGAGVLSVVAGAAVAPWRLGRRVTLVLALFWAAMPGAVVGQQLIATYLHWPVVYDHPPLMLLGYLARFGWIGIAAAWLAQVSMGREVGDAARVDGAGAVTLSWRIALAAGGPTLIAGGWVVAALSLAEVATVSLVRVPGIDPVSLILIEKFHRFEDGMLVSLALLLVTAALPGAILVAWAARHRQHRRELH